MKSVRKIKTTINSTIILSLLLVLSCVPEDQAKGFGKSAIVSNSPDSLNPGFGRILRDNPIILSGNKNLSENPPLGAFLDVQTNFITSNSFLLDSCSSPDGSSVVSNCWGTYKNKITSFIPTVSGTWGYDPDTDSFLQPHLHGHLRKGIDRWLEALEHSYDLANPSPATVVPPGGGSYTTAISNAIYTNSGFWYDSVLNAYAQCEDEDNAFFFVTNFSLCFGNSPSVQQLDFVEDPTIIYHELAHAFMQIMYNARNVGDITGSLDAGHRVNFGTLFYDEMGAINEGFADYFSYVMLNRTHMGEWALGRFFELSRPMDESDPDHINGVSPDSAGRLSYPIFLNYDTNEPETLFEDIHNAGQIVSHYLVALTKDFKSQCSFSHKNATNFVLYAFMETMMEMGDLTSRGSDHNSDDNVNLTRTNADLDYVSKDFVNKIYPANFRKFFQAFGRKLIQTVGSNLYCNGAVYSQDRIEQLMDDYGLLLFKTYNDNLNGYNAGVSTGQLNSNLNTMVDDANRVKSILIPKDNLIFDPTQNASEAFVFDNKGDMQAAKNALLASGQATDFSPALPANLGYNNGNGSISPGEMVGIALNLYNDSNSTMGGVQILANEWDHAKVDGTLKPCPVDNFPLSNEGAADTSGEAGVAGDCSHITKTNGGDGETLAPICFMSEPGAQQTTWVTQDVFRTTIGLPQADCLMGSSEPNNCFIRAVPGADHATYSKLDPNANWGTTLGNGSAPTFQLNNIILFEISDWIPPGTTVNCRFRARFTNCEDCYIDPSNVDNDDYLDFMYSGPDPYQVLNLTFTIID